MKERIHWAWIILATSFATVFTAYSIRLSYGILLPEMIVSLKITKTQAGFIASSFYLTYIIFSPLLGFLIDRFDARKILVLFCSIQAGGTFLMGKPQSLLEACLFFAIVGVGSSAMWTPVVTLVQRWFGVKRRGTVLGLLSISYAIGYGIMGLALPPLVERYDWRTCWLILSGLAFALVPLNGFLMRTKPQDMNLKPWGSESDLVQENPSIKPSKGVSYRELLKLPSLWLAGIAYFFIGFTAYITNLFIVTYGTMELRYPFAQAARLASAIAFSGIVGALFIPILSDYLGRKKCLILIHAFMSGSILLIIWAGDHWPSLFLTVCLFGVFYAAAWPMYAAAAADFFPREATGTVLGFWTIFYGLALILAPTLGGYVADLTGTFIWPFFIAAAAGFLGAAFFSGVKKYDEPFPEKSNKKVASKNISML
ncbi:MAG: MFS transporter [Thermodesulfobacteriota bacterium]|nr:MFS transporter [Thermodesulfobacteriota bacterium]